MFYIYAYIDPNTNLPFYIGKGTGNRKFSHLNESQSKKENPEKFNIIESLIKSGTPPIIAEIESNIENEELAYNREDFYILKYGRKGIEPYGILTNKCLNAKPPRPIWTAEKKKNHSNFNKQYWTPERRKEHGLKTKGNSGGKVTRGTVNVTDLSGQNRRIPKDVYDRMDRTGDINTWEYVSVSSKEAKRRRQPNTP